MHGEEEHDDLDLMACCELYYDTIELSLNGMAMESIDFRFLFAYSAGR